MRVNLLALIGRDTHLTRTCSKHGGEYAGPCPLCRRGTDRFKVWPQIERWACLGPEAGRAGCDLSGDGIQYLRQRDGLSYAEACAALGIREAAGARMPATGSAAGKDGGTAATPFAPLDHRVAPASPPNALWQARGRTFVARCQAHLWRDEGRKALAWLHGRGLKDETLRAAGAGYQPQTGREERALWGLSPDEGERAKAVWLPRGVVLPWFVDGALWRINIRRPISAVQAAAGQPKYVGPAGFANALYNADALAPDRPVALVEGEIDALTVAQEAGDLIAAVATGSTAGGRRAPWIEMLAQAPFVLVAFDCDCNGAGEQAARWWLQALPNALRWRPLLHDANAMLTAGVSVRQWIAGGIEHAKTMTTRCGGRKGIES